MSLYLNDCDFKKKKIVIISTALNEYIFSGTKMRFYSIALRMNSDSGRHSSRVEIVLSRVPAHPAVYITLQDNTAHWVHVWGLNPGQGVSN